MHAESLLPVTRDRAGAEQAELRAEADALRAENSALAHRLEVASSERVAGMSHSIP